MKHGLFLDDIFFGYQKNIAIDFHQLTADEKVDLQGYIKSHIEKLTSDLFDTNSTDGVVKIASKAYKKLSKGLGLPTKLRYWHLDCGYIDRFLERVYLLNAISADRASIHKTLNNNNIDMKKIYLSLRQILKSRDDEWVAEALTALEKQYPKGEHNQTFDDYFNVHHRQMVNEINDILKYIDDPKTYYLDLLRNTYATKSDECAYLLNKIGFYLRRGMISKNVLLDIIERKDFDGMSATVNKLWLAFVKEEVEPST